MAIEQLYVELLKVAASFLTPITVIFVGYLLNKRLKSYEDERRKSEIESNRKYESERELERLIYEEEKKLKEDEREQNRMRIERVHEEIIEFNVEANSLGIQSDEHIFNVILGVNNKGNVLKKIKKLKLRIRGIKEKDSLSCDSSRLEFPHIILEENIMPDGWYYIFIEPKVHQKINFVTKISSEFTYLLVKAEFQYSGKGEHSVERAFAL